MFRIWSWYVNGLGEALTAQHPVVTTPKPPRAASRGLCSADRSLRASAISCLSAEPSLQGCRIPVQALTGVVVLEGTVPDGEAVRAAGVAAWRASGVRDVCNRLRV